MTDTRQVMEEVWAFLDCGLPDDIEIYRAIKAAGTRSNAGIAKAVDAMLEPYRVALAITQAALRAKEAGDATA